MRVMVMLPDLGCSMSIWASSASSIYVAMALVLISSKLCSMLVLKVFRQLV